MKNILVKIYHKRRFFIFYNMKEYGRYIKVDIIFLLHIVFGKLYRHYPFINYTYIVNKWVMGSLEESFFKL